MVVIDLGIGERGPPRIKRSKPQPSFARVR